MNFPLGKRWRVLLSSLNFEIKKLFNIALIIITKSEDFYFELNVVLLFVQARQRCIFPAPVALCQRLEDGEDAVENQTSINHAKHEKHLIPSSRRFENQEYYFAYLLEVE